MELNILWIKKTQILCYSDFIYWIYNFLQADSRQETQINQRFNLQVRKRLCENSGDIILSGKDEKKFIINETNVKKGSRWHFNQNVNGQDSKVISWCHNGSDFGWRESGNLSSQRGKCNKGRLWKIISGCYASIKSCLKCFIGFG